MAKITVISRDRNGAAITRKFEAAGPKAIANEGVLQIVASTLDLVAVFPINHLESVVIEEFVKE